MAGAVRIFRGRWLDAVAAPGFSDSVFLAVVVGLSVIPYVGRLGFYSDDWAFLAVLTTADDRSFGGLLRDQAAWSPSLAMRPTQTVYQAWLYRNFGLDPLGYHLVNAGVLIAIAVLLYWILRELRLPRSVAVAVPAVYALMPNYATDRFWFAAFGYLLSMALYLLGLFAELRAASSDHARLWIWKVFALAALAAAAFGYEVILPLFLLNVILAEVVARRGRRGGLRAKVGSWGVAAFYGSTLAVAASAIAFKATVAEGIGTGSPLTRHALRLAAGVVTANFGTYGVGFPHTVWWSAPYAGAGGVALGIVLAICLYRYLAIVRGATPDANAPLSRHAWMRLAGAGSAIFMMGYLVFLVTGRIAFSSTGIANRVAAASALGSAIVLVALVGWSASWSLHRTIKDRLFRAGVALLCGGGVVITTGLASFWIESRDAQQDVLTELHTALPVLPPDSTVLLDDVCPYIGPAIVFESSWDLRGALRVYHHDPSLEADVTSGVVLVEPRGVVTQIYRSSMVHPYGDQLFLYDHSTGVTVLRDESAARQALSDDPVGSDCPEGRPGAGAVTLPFDVLFGWIESRLSAPP